MHTFQLFVKRNKTSLFIHFLTLLIVVLTYEGGKREMCIPILVIGVSIAFGVRQNKIEHDKIFLALFTSFTNKYEQKFSHDLKRIEIKVKSDKNYQLSEQEYIVVIDYLNFCSEEYVWYKKGRIEASVWTAWETGMKHYLSLSSVKEVLAKEREGKDSYYRLYERLNMA